MFSADTTTRILQLVKEILSQLETPLPEKQFSTNTQMQTLQRLEQFARALGLLPPSPSDMADVIQTIGTASRDWSTISAWEAQLDSGTYYSSGDNAIGECYDDSAFDESATIDGGNTIGLNSITLRAASGEGHDGTAGSGVRMVATASDRQLYCNNSSINVKIEQLEWDLNGNSAHWEGAIRCGADTTITRCIVHDSTNTTSVGRLIRHNGGSQDVAICNNIVYDMDQSHSSADLNGIRVQWVSGGSGNPVYCYNNTIYDLENTNGSSTGDVYGINAFEDFGDQTVKNNISMGATTSGSGEAFDFEWVSTSIDSDYNLSEDDTADDGGGSNNLISKTVADQFVSTTGGSEDLHLKSGADAIDAGTDLGTTPSGVEIDIDGRDRDANGDVWDIGADEFTSASVETMPWLSDNTYTPKIFKMREIVVSY